MQHDIEGAMDSVQDAIFKPLTIPKFEPGVCGNWTLKSFQLSPPVIGYFGLCLDPVKENWALLKHAGTRSEKCWMSLTPMELESQGYHANLAHGHVVVCGLGMGVLVWNLLNNPKVTHVTVIEKDRNIGRLFKRIRTIDDEGWTRVGYNEPSGLTKLDVVHSSALKPSKWCMDYVKLKPADVLIVDIWPSLGSDKALPDVKKIQSWVNAKKVAWWGQEFDICDHMVARKKFPPITGDDIAEFENHHGFKLLPGEVGDLYGPMVERALITSLAAFNVNKNHSAMTATIRTVVAKLKAKAK